MKSKSSFFLICFMVMSWQPILAGDLTLYYPDAAGNPVVAVDVDITYKDDGSVDEITSTILWREHYQPYGKKLNNPVNNDIGYTGHEYDQETGLTYMQARYYDPVAGRFLAIDPVGFRPTQPMTFNRYSYANNNPYKYVDPNGEAALLLNAFRKDVTHQQAMQISGVSTAATKVALISGGATTTALAIAPEATIAISVKQLAKQAIRQVASRGASQAKSKAAEAASGLANLGRAGRGKGVREVTGNAGDAKKLFSTLKGSNPVKEVKPGVFTAPGANGGTVTFRTNSKSGPPTVDVNGIAKGVRKIKFIEN